MFRANIDTPWTKDGDSFVPALSIDPAFAPSIKGWTDVTGSDGLVVDVGGGEMKHLYGGNYAKAANIQPDYSVGRLGGSGDPDWLTIQITTDDDSIFPLIDAEDDYQVLWTEEIIEEDAPVTVAAAYRKKEVQPTTNEWGLLRAKYGRRGYSQAWIDKYIDKREIMWGQHDHNIKAGYLRIDDVIEPEEEVSIPQLVAFLVNEGWEASGDAVVNIVTGGVTVEILQEWLENCDFSALNNPPLETDLCQGMQAQGFCSQGCS